MTSDVVGAFARKVSNVRSASVTSFEQLATGSARQLYNWWIANQQTALQPNSPPTPPQQSAFDIVDHRAIAAHLFLIKRLGPSRYDYRIIGESTRFLLGSRVDMNELVELFVPGFTQSVPAYLDTVCEQAWPQHTLGVRIWSDHNKSVPFEGLDCPLVNEAGEISHIIGTVAPIDPNDQTGISGPIQI